MLWTYWEECQAVYCTYQKLTKAGYVAPKLRYSPTKTRFFPVIAKRTYALLVRVMLDKASKQAEKCITDLGFNKRRCRTWCRAVAGKGSFGRSEDSACYDSPTHWSWRSTNRAGALQCGRARELAAWTTGVAAHPVCRTASEAEAWHKLLSKHCSVTKRNRTTKYTQFHTPALS